MKLLDVTFLNIVLEKGGRLTGVLIFIVLTKMEGMIV